MMIQIFSFLNTAVLASVRHISHSLFPMPHSQKPITNAPHKYEKRYKYIKTKLITSSVLGLSLLITPAALADYVPPSDQTEPSDYTGQGGSRDGCEVEGVEGVERIPLTALVPLSHVGQTVSTRPTLAWFVPNSTRKPMQLRLHKYDSDGTPQPIGEVISMESSPGIMAFTLPENGPELKVGQTYLWQVSIICNPDKESSILIAEEDIQVVEKPSDWENMLLNRSSASDFYADEGLWYDALNEAIKLAEESRQGEVSSLLEELITREEEEIKQQELNQRELKNIRRRIENLREIADSLQMNN
ncbi:MAG: DUF928 domain-containing protein [Symploca sp. SIO3E6]|nr:DUF928 domain-containing protein [Caldora sp. SIO3E6]